MDSFIELGYLGLFIASFLAATILPLSSEIVLSALLLNGFDFSLIVGIATIGNVLGAVTNYFLGKYGGLLVVKKWLRVSDKEYEKSLDRFNRFGVISLFFAWVPVIGDPLTIVAGILKIRFDIFLLLVSLGKFLRYLIIAAVLI